MVNHILKSSHELKCIVTIIYQKGSEITKRNIQVIDINDNHVKAFCYLRNELRIFKLDNILSANYLSIAHKSVPLYKNLSQL
jgi:predicted DNA-binding transcriptional regulator YafY